MSDEDWIILDETFQCCEKMVVKKESCQWTKLFYLECVVACWVENKKTKAGLTLLSPWLTVRLFQYWVGEQGQGRERLALAALPGLAWRRSACPLGPAATNHEVSILSYHIKIKIRWKNALVKIFKMKNTVSVSSEVPFRRGNHPTCSIAPKNKNGKPKI